MGNLSREPSPLSELCRVEMDANFREWGERTDSRTAAGRHGNGLWRDADSHGGWEWRLSMEREGKGGGGGGTADAPQGRRYAGMGM